MPSRNFELLVRGAMIDALLSFEDELGDPPSTVSAASVAHNRWLRTLEQHLLPRLRSEYVAAFREVSPDGDVNSPADLYVEAIRYRLEPVVSRLLDLIQRDMTEAQMDGRSIRLAAMDRLEDLTDDTWRPTRIAATEMTSANAAGTFAAAERIGLNEPDVVLTWRTMGDHRVRSSHDGMDGQERPPGRAFLSDSGNLLRHPGDPLAPASEVANCRCVLEVDSALLAAARAPQDEEPVDCCPDVGPGEVPDVEDDVIDQANESMGEYAGGADRNRGGAEKLRRYWTTGAGGQKIGWRTPGDFTRCVGFLEEHMPGRAEGYCANRHKEMTGMWPGDKKNRMSAAFVAGLSIPNQETPMPTETTPGSEPVMTGLPNGWTGCLAPLGVMSGDGRRIMRAGDAPRTRPLPMEMGWQQSNEGGHDGAVTAARIDRVWYESHDGRDCLHGEGAFDLDGMDGRELARRVKDGFAGGVSVDLVDVTAAFEYVLPSGEAVPEPASAEEWLSLTEGGAREVMSVTDWELGSTTFVSIPAFSDARVKPIYGYERAGTLVAAVAGEQTYLAADFDRPEASEPTPLTITDDGVVYGHLAIWNTCHVGIANACTTAPKSRTSYAYFHVGAVATDQGDLPVGRLTVGTGHAEPRGGVIPTLAHYDNSGSAVAVVRAKDGKHGVWVSGALIHGAHSADIAALRRSPLSGDWRRVGGNLELVAALAVNTPGFPVPRGMVASIGDEQVSLVAAGALPAVPASPSTRLPSPEEYASAVMQAIKNEQRAGRLAEELAVRLGVDNDSRAKNLAARVLGDG